MSANDEVKPGTCEVCGARALFGAERRCWRHPVNTSIVVRLAEGERTVRNDIAALKKSGSHPCEPGCGELVRVGRRYRRGHASRGRRRRA